MKTRHSILVVPAVAVVLAGSVASDLMLTAQKANAVECGSTANRSGCVSPHGAATYNKNTGQVHTAKPYYPNSVAPGTSVQGSRGTATKAVKPGCAYVNGQRKCY